MNRVALWLIVVLLAAQVGLTSVAVYQMHHQRLRDERRDAVVWKLDWLPLYP